MPPSLSDVRYRHPWQSDYCITAVKSPLWHDHLVNIFPILFLHQIGNDKENTEE